MYFEDSETGALLKEFPNIKLSYETIAHKKVFDYDCVVAIPEGKKYFAWFKMHLDKPICILMEISDNKQIASIKIVHACFQDELCYGSGTIFYGTCFYYDNSQFFTIEDINYYQGNNVGTLKYLEKLQLFTSIFQKSLRQISYNKQFIVFGLPVMHKSFQELLKVVDSLHYSVSSIQYRYFDQSASQIYTTKYNKQTTMIESTNKSNNNNNNNNKSNNSSQRTGAKRETIFNCKPDIQNDIYHLYTKININGEYSDYLYDTAYIPDYKTSVFMNKLFRNIKENANLDALEESDDEEEFENDKPDKFVFLDRVYTMTCSYNYKFKRWVPCRVAPRGSKVALQKDLE